MYQLTCGISSLLHSVNLILFTVLLVHLILRISPHHSHHLRSHHLSLPQTLTPDLKLISFTTPLPPQRLRLIVLAVQTAKPAVKVSDQQFYIGLCFIQQSCNKIAIKQLCCVGNI